MHDYVRHMARMVVTDFAVRRGEVWPNHQREAAGYVPDAIQELADAVHPAEELEVIQSFIRSFIQSFIQISIRLVRLYSKFQL
jgi:hypothetical protein